MTVANFFPKVSSDSATFVMKEASLKFCNTTGEGGGSRNLFTHTTSPITPAITKKVNKLSQCLQGVQCRMKVTVHFKITKGGVLQ